jgi:hypothetical protein
MKKWFSAVCATVALVAFGAGIVLRNLLSPRRHVKDIKNDIKTLKEERKESNEKVANIDKRFSDNVNSVLDD